MTKEEYFKGWMRIVEGKALDTAVERVSQLYRSKRIMPEYKDIFKAFHLCPWEEFKVLLLGQDPYPQPGVATGLAFGNNKPPLSPSLEILKEACVDYSIPHPPIKFDNTLESWAKQGVLLLNSSLTVETYRPGSHVNIWRPFIAEVLKNICNFATGIVYVLMGRQAQSFEPYINGRFNYIIKTPHPSYYARTGQAMPHIFRDIDKILKGIYNKSINWYEVFF